MSGSIQYTDERMMRQVDERDEDMGMDEYGVSISIEWKDKRVACCLSRKDSSHLPYEKLTAVSAEI
jgi:hypothetical protein